MQRCQEDLAHASYHMSKMGALRQEGKDTRCGHAMHLHKVGQNPCSTGPYSGGLRGNDGK